MERIKISVIVNPAAALADGRVMAGRGSYEPSEAEVAELTLEERAALLDVSYPLGGGYYPGSSYGHRSDPVQISEITWPQIVACLRARMAAEVAVVAERKRKETEYLAREQAESDAIRARLTDHPEEGVQENTWGEWVPTADALRVRGEHEEAARALARLRNAEKSAILAKAKAEREASEKAAAEALHAARTAWLAEHGTPSQQERWAEGLLPESELRVTIRDHVFAGLADFDRYEPLKIDVCAGDECPGEIIYKSEPLTALTAEEYEQLKAIRAAAPEGATVEPRRHFAVCDQRGCDVLSGERDSVLVSITVLGCELSREYALPRK